MFWTRRLKKHLDYETVEEKLKTESSLPLEKGDLSAIFIAAAVVFLPLILSFGGIMFLLYWLFVGRF